MNSLLTTFNSYFNWTRFIYSPFTVSASPMVEKIHNSGASVIANLKANSGSEFQKANKRWKCTRLPFDSVQGIAQKALNDKELILNLNHQTAIPDSTLRQILESCPPSLKVIEIASLAIEDATLAYIGDTFKSLEVLNISGCTHITKEGSKVFAEKCTTLKALNISSFKESEQFNALLFANKELQCLHLTGTIFCNSSLQALAECDQLKIMIADTHCEATDQDFVAFIKNCPNITELDLSWWTKIGDESMLAIGTFAPKLERLTLSVNGEAIDNFSASAFVQLASTTPLLKSFLLGVPIQFSASELLEMLSYWKDLIALDIDNMSAIPEASLLKIGNLCPKLKKWELGHLSRAISDATWVEIFKLMPDLRKISFNQSVISLNFLNLIKRDNVSLSFDTCAVSTEGLSNFDNPDLAINVLSAINVVFRQSDDNSGFFNLLQANQKCLHILTLVGNTLPLSDEQLQQLQFPSLISLVLRGPAGFGEPFTDFGVAGVITTTKLIHFSNLAAPFGLEVARALNGQPLNSVTVTDKIPYYSPPSEESPLAVKEVKSPLAAWQKTQEPAGLEDSQRPYPSRISKGTFWQLSEEGASAFKEFMTNNPIQELYVFCSSISSKSLASSILERNYLSEVSISQSDLDDEGFMAILAGCPTLREFDVYTTKVTEETVEEARALYPYVTIQFG